MTVFRWLAGVVCLGVVLTFAPAVPVGAQEQGAPRVEDLARLVNPYIGTKKGCCTGLTYPGAVAPFGMVQWSPDTVTPQVGGYNYNDNRIKGAFYIDASLTQGFKLGGKEMQLFFNVSNLLDKNPPVVAPGPAGSAYATPATNQSIYDLLGRTFRIGARFKM